MNIQGNIEITEAIKSHVEHCNAKLDKYDNKHNFHPKVNLTVLSSKNFKCHVIINDINTESTSEDMYVSITEAFEKVETILEKNKSKIIAKRYVQPQFNSEIDE